MVTHMVSVGVGGAFHFFLVVSVCFLKRQHVVNHTFTQFYTFHFESMSDLRHTCQCNALF